MTIAAGLPNRLRDCVDRELATDERVVWMEMPVPRFFSGKAAGVFLFGIPCTAFAVFWICGAAEFKVPDFSSAHDVFPLFGIPFALIGLLMISAPLFAYRSARRSVYIITNRRAITIENQWGFTIRSYTPEKLQNVYRHERSDGTGDVIIGYREWRDSEGDRCTENLGFMGIRNPKEVESMLKDLAAKLP